MKRSVLAAVAAATLGFSQTALAQSPTNNPNLGGPYFAAGLGLNILDDTEFEDEENVVVTAEANAGFFTRLALGYVFPVGPVGFRAEGELALRANEVEEVDDNGVQNLDALENSDISSIAGMLNGYFDWYVLPNTALTLGFGLGYANVQADIAVDLDGVDVVLFDEESDAGFAYQSMLGARYDFNGGSSIDIGYTYFAADGLTVVDDIDDFDNDFDYSSHTFHIGYAYRF